MNRPILSKSGFTLVETIFSTLFLSLTVLAIINLFPGAYLSVRKSETQLQSDAVANSVIEELRSTPFRELVAGPYTTPAAALQPITLDGITYAPQVTLYDVPNADPRFLKGVRVEIKFQMQAVSRTVVHETYLHSLVR